MKGLIERKITEKRRFDSEYGSIKRSLLISLKEIERYRHPSDRPVQAREFSHFLIGRNLAGQFILDYGCGAGQNAVFLAKRGAMVFAADISEKGAQVTKQKAHINGVGERVMAVVMDAENTPFKNSVFNGILGNAILHHLNIPKALCELKRILKPGAKAVFREPYIANNAIRKLRRFIPYYPSSPTAGESPLSPEDLAFFGREFGGVSVWCFEVFSRINYLLKNNFLIRLLLKIDYRFKKVLRPFASCVVFMVKRQV